MAGPGHTFAIDSTVGDLFLRSSINRAWIIGRPIVYVIVDVWSTAVVGFYVCLTGPSWATAKISLFNATADQSLIADLWGYEAVQVLDPAPTLCHALLCDRGEYLSQGHRETALKLKLRDTQYTPPYRGDLKGNVEVLHRIAKDAQFTFIPGAIDARREELELRKIDPRTCTFTLRDYVHFLHYLFKGYNLSAPRDHRLDQEMIAMGVSPSPAGLWNWGHAMGIGYRQHTTTTDLITTLLPMRSATVLKSGIRCDQCDYSSTEVEEGHWTTLARNYGSWEIPAYRYPGTMGSIWTPNPQDAGLLRLRLSDQANVSRLSTADEWADALAVKAANREAAAHDSTMHALATLKEIQRLRDEAATKTEEALARAAGSSPTMGDARALEVFTANPSSHPSSTFTPAPAQISKPQDAVEVDNRLTARLLGQIDKE